LEELLDASGDLIVLFSDDDGVEHSGAAVQGIDGGVDSEFG